MFDSSDIWNYVWDKVSNPGKTLLPTWGKYAGPGWIAGEVWNVRVPPPELVARTPPQDWVDSVARKHDIRFILAADIDDPEARRNATRQADIIFVRELQEGIATGKISPFSQEFLYASAGIAAFQVKLASGLSDLDYVPLSREYRFAYRYLLAELERDPFQIIILPEEMFGDQDTVQDYVPRPKPKPAPAPPQPAENDTPDSGTSSGNIDEKLKKMTTAELRELVLLLTSQYNHPSKDKIRRDRDLLALASQIPPPPPRYRW